MDLIIDATSTQDKAFAGIGQYTHHLTVELCKNPLFLRKYLLLYEGESTLDSALNRGDSTITVVRVGARPGAIRSFLSCELQLRPALIRLKTLSPKAVYFCPHILRGFPRVGYPVLLTVLDYALQKFNYYSNRGGIFNFLRKLEVKYRNDRILDAQAVVTDSESARQDALEFYPTLDKDKIKSILLGVELEEKIEPGFEQYLPREWQERGYIVYLGGGTQRNKNSEGVVRAYRRFLQLLAASSSTDSRAAPYLVIAGKIFTNGSNEARRFQQYITDLGLSDKIHFTGFFEDKYKYALLRNSLFFTHLSLYEGFGIAVAEAMRAGCAVVVHNGSSYPEVVQDSGILVDGADPEECAESYLRLFLDPNLREEFGIKANRRSMAFDWQKTAEQTAQMLQIVYNEQYGRAST